MAFCKNGDTISWDNCSTNTQMYYSELWAAEEHGRAGRVYERFFPTFSFVPDSDAHALHIVLKYWTGLRKDPKNNSWHRKFAFR